MCKLHVEFCSVRDVAAANVVHASVLPDATTAPTVNATIWDAHVPPMTTPCAEGRRAAAVYVMALVSATKATRGRPVTASSPISNATRGILCARAMVHVIAACVFASWATWVSNSSS